MASALLHALLLVPLNAVPRISEASFDGSMCIESSSNKWQHIKQYWTIELLHSRLFQDPLLPDDGVDFIDFKRIIIAESIG